jgi:hypothetical protein
LWATLFLRHQRRKGNTTSRDSRPIGLRSPPTRSTIYPRRWDSMFGAHTFASLIDLSLRENRLTIATRGCIARPVRDSAKAPFQCSTMTTDLRLLRRCPSTRNQRSEKGRTLSPLMAGVGGALEGGLLPWDLKNFAGVCLVRFVSKDDPRLCSQSDIERHTVKAPQRP